MKLFKALELSYDQYSTTVKNYLSKTFSNFGVKYNNSTIFGQIISVIEATVQNILLYIEDAFTEQNKFTATRKKSIYGLAQLTGYNPSTGKAAGFQLKLSYTPTNTETTNVIINNKEPIVCSQNGLQYNIILPQDAIIVNTSNDLTNKYLYAVEGQFETQYFVSTGGQLYLEHLDVTGDIDEDYMEVRINDELWEKVDSLYDMQADGKQWFSKTSVVSGIIIGFGNDIHGRALQDGDNVSITYLKHNGEYGNINNLEAVEFSFVDSLKNVSGDDVDGNTLFNITVANTDSVTSGTFSEDISQVKQMIGYTSRALVLASPENYKSFINRFSFCGYNRTWSEVGSLVINSLIMRNYKINLEDSKDYFNLQESDFFLTDAQKESLQNCIKNSGRQLAGVIYNIKDPKLKKYALYVYLKMKDTSYDTNYITEQVRSLIGEFFTDLSQDNYIPKSDIIHLIKNNIEEVDGVNCYFISEENEKAIINKKYTEEISKYNPTTNTYDTTISTVYLYDGEDPGLGLDSHGNILLENNDQYPVLMGGWSYISSSDNQTTFINDPLIISFEN
jgi:hypothetical protein